MNRSLFTTKDVVILNRKLVYDGHFKMARYEVKYKLFNGQWSENTYRELFERSSAVAVLPYDPIADQVVLIEQFRLGALSDPNSPWLIETVAGIFEPEEKPEEVAIREAKEEANCKILDLYPICEYFVSPGGSDERLALFCGRIDSNHVDGVYGVEDEHEDIRTFTLSLEDALHELKQGNINTSPGIIALQWLQINHLWLKELWKK